VAGLVGREPEIAVIENFLAAVEAGFAALELVGEAGIGKTTVWQAAVRRAAELGFPVLSARPAESESRLSFAGLTDLLAPSPRMCSGRCPCLRRRHSMSRFSAPA
jgi:Predicted ATPase